MQTGLGPFLPFNLKMHRIRWDSHALMVGKPVEESDAIFLGRFVVRNRFYFPGRTQLGLGLPSQGLAEPRGRIRPHPVPSDTKGRWEKMGDRIQLGLPFASRSCKAFCRIPSLLPGGRTDLTSSPLLDGWAALLPNSSSWHCFSKLPPWAKRPQVRYPGH